MSNNSRKRNLNSYSDDYGDDVVDIQSNERGEFNEGHCEEYTDVMSGESESSKRTNWMGDGRDVSEVVSNNRGEFNNRSDTGKKAHEIGGNFSRENERDRIEGKYNLEGIDSLTVYEVKFLFDRNVVKEILAERTYKKENKIVTRPAGHVTREQNIKEGLPVVPFKERANTLPTTRGNDNHKALAAQGNTLLAEGKKNELKVTKKSLEIFMFLEEVHDKVKEGVVKKEEEFENSLTKLELEYFPVEGSSKKRDIAKLSKAKEAMLELETTELKTDLAVYKSFGKSLDKIIDKFKDAPEKCFAGYMEFMHSSGIDYNDLDIPYVDENDIEYTISGSDMMEYFFSSLNEIVPDLMNEEKAKPSKGMIHLRTCYSELYNHSFKGEKKRVEVKDPDKTITAKEGLTHQNSLSDDD